MGLALIFYFSVCTLKTFAQPSKLTFKHITSSQGLSQNHGMCIYQDSRGFMWFGTQSGLNKYDGYTITVYRNSSKDSTSLSDNYINVIYEDHLQNLWIGTRNGLNRYDRTLDRFFRYHIGLVPSVKEDKPSPDNNQVQDIKEDSQGKLWIATYNNGLLLFDQKTNRFTRYLPREEDPFSIGDAFISCLYPDKNGNLWVGTINNGLDFLDGKTNKFTHYRNNPSDPTSLSHNQVRSIQEDRQGNVWVGTLGGGLNRLDRKTNTFTRFTHEEGNEKSLTGNSVLKLLEDAQGNLWIGVENGGLDLYEPGSRSFRHFKADKYDNESLSNNTVSALFQDKSGTIWVGVHRGGINYFRNEKPDFLKYKQQASLNSLSHNNVKALLEDRNGRIWIGTDGGGVNVFDPKTEKFISYQHHANQANGLSSNAVLSLLEDQEGKIWMGTWNGGLNVYDPVTGRFSVYKNDPNDSTSISGDRIWALEQDQHHHIWIATTGKGINVFNPETKKFTRFQRDKRNPRSISGDYFHCIYRDQKQNIWVGTFQGLFLYHPESNDFTGFRHSDLDTTSLSHNVVNCIYQDYRGKLWVGTRKGLNLFDPDTKTFKVFNEDHGMPSEEVMGITEDGKGYLWISTLKGITQFDPEKKTFKNYTEYAGLQGNEFTQNALLKTRDGKLLFGGTEGFNLFHPDSIRTNSFIPPVVLTDFQIFNKPVNMGEDTSPLRQHISEAKEIILSYDQSVISFEFAALSYLSQENNRYAYRLEGFDKDWNYVGTQRKATYTNLDPGKYVFRVIGSNNDGVWNEVGTSLEVIVQPPFWRTWWFRSAMGLLIIGSVFTFYRVRMRTIKAQKAALEKQVIIRTSEVREQKEELQQQAENLQRMVVELQQKQEEIWRQRNVMQRVNEQVMSSIRYANTIQKALLPSEKKISQNLPEHFIIYRPKDVVSGDFYWFSFVKREGTDEEENDLIFMAVIDCTGHGVPGAFMSIIGHTLLNEIINLKRVFDPAQILEQLDLGVNSAIEKAEGLTTAGMDVCLIQLQRQEGDCHKIRYAGAKRPLYFVRKDSMEVEVLEASRRSIGSHRTVGRTKFATRELILEKGARLYLTTDGYVDQNNPERIKLGTRRFKEIIIQVAEQPLQVQKQTLEQVLDAHQQTADQRDDITLIGVKL
jgi:ligand-binding sensor domain-containing protein/serine phosphatase RsbU (regulator of sigma subunit)